MLVNLWKNAFANNRKSEASSRHLSHLSYVEGGSILDFFLQILKNKWLIFIFHFANLLMTYEGNVLILKIERYYNIIKI